MTLSDFEAHIPSPILARGLAYYHDGNILHLEREDGTWIAAVEGTDDYTVSVSLTGSGTISDAFCDCPYDGGRYCKHEAAVFYALRDMAQSGTMPKASPKKETLKDALGKLDKQTLLAIVLEFAGRDRQMKETLMLRYAPKTNTVESARALMRSAISAVKHRGFVEYRDTAQATSGADTVLSMAEASIASGDAAGAVALCIAVAHEMMALMDYCDDSDGYVGGAITEAIETMGRAAQIAPGDDETLFDAILAHARDAMYNGWWDWRMAVTAAAIPLCASKRNRDLWERYLSKNRKNDDDDQWNTLYTNQRLQELQYALIQRFDGEDAAAAYVDLHVDNPTFRRLAIQAAMDTGDYERGLRLCLQGEQPHGERVYRSEEWKTFRYAIYERIGDVQGLITVGTELLLRGNFDYFPKIKSLYDKDAWSAALQSILTHAETGDRQDIYTKILVHEDLKERLLAYCKGHPSRITAYYDRLIPEHVEAVGAIFVALIRGEAARAGDRKAYSAVCALLKHYGRVHGSAAHALRDELARTYPRRRAFLDELGKALG